MRLGVLFSGGKDSTYAMYLAKKQGHQISCLISIHSENKNSYMFHTPAIENTISQAKTMNLPIIIQKTRGVKEKELSDLTKAIKQAKEKYNIQGIVTGAVESVYQASRIQKICNNLNLECFNPLWQRDELQYLQELIDNNFKVIIVGVAAYPLDNSWLGRVVNDDFIRDIRVLKEKYKIHPAGEGGEFETFVLNCPMFKKELKVKSHQDFKEGENSWRREIKIK